MMGRWEDGGMGGWGDHSVGVGGRVMKNIFYKSIFFVGICSSCNLPRPGSGA